jgi:hypothetical protein
MHTTCYYWALSDQVKDFIQVICSQTAESQNDKFYKHIFPQIVTIAIKYI